MRWTQPLQRAVRAGRFAPHARPEGWNGGGASARPADRNLDSLFLPSTIEVFYRTLRPALGSLSQILFGHQRRHLFSQCQSNQLIDRDAFLGGQCGGAIMQGLGQTKTIIVLMATPMRRDLTQAKELARRLDQGASEQVYNFSRRTPKRPPRLPDRAGRRKPRRSRSSTP
jgi:hypothetical protein